MNELEAQKHLVDKAVSFLEKIVNPPLKELGGLLSDKVKFWRFKNQINIILQAENFLKEKNIKPKKIPLKILYPLLQYSSWEEDKYMKRKWASLLANATNSKYSNDINLNYVEILNQITPLEAKILDYLYGAYNSIRDIDLRRGDKITPPRHTSFHKQLAGNCLKIPEEEFNIFIDNLYRLNLIQPVEYTKDKGLIIRIRRDQEKLRLTSLGYDFVKKCRIE